MTIRQSMAEGKLTTQLIEFADRAMCSWMQVPGMQEAVPWLTVGLAQVPVPKLKALSVGLFALQAGCNFANENVPGGPEIEGTYQTGCGCRVNVKWYEPSGGINPVWQSDLQQFTLVGVETRNFPHATLDLVANTLVYTGIDAGLACVDSPPEVRVDFGPMPREDLSGAKLTLASDCSTDPDGPIPDNPGPPPELPKYTGDTIDNSCNVTAELIAVMPGVGNSAVPVIKMTNNGPTAAAVRDPGGGIIGGCNWDGDLIFVGGDGEGPPVIGPPPPDGPTIPSDDGPAPDWLNDFLRALGADIVGDIVEGLVAPEVEAAEWFMKAPCDVDPESGEPAEITKQFPKAKLPEATIQRVDAIPEFLGQHLAWKTPICHDRPVLEGDWITIEFESDETSPMGNCRLRKRFRYRSKSGRELGELIDYWRNFSWTAGPVCVIHSGAWWGTPQSWAGSVDEGKRLIQYAAAEAGLDPDQIGKWTVSGSNNPRFGMPGTMRIRINKGTYCITNRLGSNGLPLVGRVMTDP